MNEKKNRMYLQMLFRPPQRSHIKLASFTRLSHFHVCRGRWLILICARCNWRDFYGMNHHHHSAGMFLICNRQATLRRFKAVIVPSKTDGKRSNWAQFRLPIVVERRCRLCYDDVPFFIPPRLGSGSLLISLAPFRKKAFTKYIQVG